MSNHLKKFFASYTEFTYNSSVPASQQFQRLRRQSQWGHDSPEGNEAWDRFRDALVLDFNGLYGTNEEDLQAWHALCAVLGVKPVPETVNACRAKIKGIHVNLVDLVDFANGAYDKKVVRLFPTEMALSQYTKEKEKYFPRNNVHAGGLLKYLLRQILNPRAEETPVRRGGEGDTRGRGNRGRAKTNYASQPGRERGKKKKRGGAGHRVGGRSGNK